MKKSLTVGLAILCACHSLFATPLTGIGSGTTTDAAKSSALKDLTEQVVLSSTYVTMLSNKEDTKGNAVSSFQSSSLETGSFMVMGVTYDTSAKNGKEYTIKAVIDDNEANKALYLSKTEETALSINNLKTRIDETKEESLKSDLYFTLLKLLDDYDFYKGVATKLYAPAALPGNTIVSISRKEAEAYCNSFLRQSSNNKESQIELLKLQLQNQALTKESRKAIEKQIEASSRELEEMKARQRKITEDSQAKFQELRMLFNASIADAQTTLGEATAEDSIQMLNSSLSTIKTYGNFYEETRTNLKDYLNSLYVSAEKEMKDKEESILHRAYKSIEMNGKTPKPEAVEQREKEYAAAKAAIRESFRGTETKVFKEALSQWKAIYYSTEAAVAGIVGKSFELSSKSQTYFEPSNFDLSSWIWKGTSLLTVGNETYSIDIVLPYDVWTKAHKDMNPMGLSDDSSYEVRVETAQMWQDFFENYPELVTVTIKGEIAREDGALVAKANSYTIGSSLTGEAIFTEKFELNPIVIQDLSAMDFSVSYNGGNLSAIIYDANGLDIPMPEDFIFYGGETVQLPSASELSKGTYILQGWENSYGVGYKAGATLPEGVYSGVLKALYRSLGSSSYTPNATVYSGTQTSQSNTSSGTFNNITASTSSTSSEIIKNLNERNGGTTSSYSYPEYYSSFSGQNYATADKDYALGLNMRFIVTSMKEVYPQLTPTEFTGFGVGLSFTYLDFFRANGNMQVVLGETQRNWTAKKEMFVSSFLSADAGIQLNLDPGYVYLGVGADVGFDILDTLKTRVAPLLVLELGLPMDDILDMPLNVNAGVSVELQKEKAAYSAYLGFGYFI